MVRSYGVDVGGALLVLLFSFLFPTFYVGYYAYSSFLGFATSAWREFDGIRRRGSAVL
ncbi:hypothetical protein QT238_01925 [Geobacillus stearothermophilus]|nr:hypothetical protein QT238_01925 [Geobacillus stearothermophilus]